MVVGSSDHCAKILFPIDSKPPGIIMVGLWRIPSVKCFVHHIHPQLVAGIQGDLRCRIMCHTDRIVAVFLQNPNPPFFRIRIFTGTKNTMIMVDAAALQKDTLSIDSQSVLRIPFQFSNSEGNDLFIRICFDPHIIKKRLLRRP